MNLVVRVRGEDGNGTNQMKLLMYPQKETGMAFQ
jgi:hypothetical protein